MSLKFNSDIIENYRTINIVLNFVGSSTNLLPLNSITTNFNINNIEFIPDELIINTIAYNDKSTNVTQNASMYSLSSNLVSNYTLSSFPNYGTIAAYLKLDTPFKINNSVNGNYTFTLSDAYMIDLSTGVNTVNMFITLMVTFYKYKSLDRKIKK